MPYCKYRLECKDFNPSGCGTLGVPEQCLNKKNFGLGEWSDSDVEMPEVGVPVLGVLEHFDSGKKQYAVVVNADADDHSWESDGCEIAHEYNVIRWASLPDIE